MSDFEDRVDELVKALVDGAMRAFATALAGMSMAEIQDLIASGGASGRTSGWCGEDGEPEPQAPQAPQAPRPGSGKHRIGRQAAYILRCRVLSAVAMLEKEYPGGASRQQIASLIEQECPTWFETGVRLLVRSGELRTTGRGRGRRYLVADAESARHKRDGAVPPMLGGAPPPADEG